MKYSFGGTVIKRNPKLARPISTKHLMHVVLKSDKARGAHSLLRYERQILILARRLAIKSGVVIKDIVIMGNHIHLLVKCLRRRGLAQFLRAFAGIIVRKIVGAEKGQPSKLKEFFSGRPFSRIVAGGRKCFTILKKYFDLNRLEKLGFSKKDGYKLLLCPSLELPPKLITL